MIKCNSIIMIIFIVSMNKIPFCLCFFFHTQIKPLTQRRIKLNRELGRKSSTETTGSDRATLAPEKTSSTSERSTSAHASNVERPSSNAESFGRKERSSSTGRGVSRERPGSAGDRQHDSDREQSRSSRPSRERDRERDKNTVSDKERDRTSGSSSQRAPVTLERDSEGERSLKTERKSSGSGAGEGRAVSLDNVTIGEKSVITRRIVDHQEKPNASSKERVEGSDRTAKSNRSVTFPIYNHDLGEK